MQVSSMNLKLSQPFTTVPQGGTEKIEVDSITVFAPSVKLFMNEPKIGAFKEYGIRAYQFIAEQGKDDEDEDDNPKGKKKKKEADPTTEEAAAGLAYMLSSFIDKQNNHKTFSQYLHEFTNLVKKRPGIVGYSSSPENCTLTDTELEQMLFTDLEKVFAAYILFLLK
jgi:hypothetical protein